MGVLTDIVLAKASEAEAVLVDYSGAPSDPWLQVNAQGLDPLKLGDLYAALLNDPEADSLDLSEEFKPIESPEADPEDGPWLMPWPARFTALLATLPHAQVPAVVAQWLGAD